MSDTQTGSVCKLLQGGSCFVTPDTAAFGDRTATIYCHAAALARNGIAADELMVGSRLRFRTKPARFKNGRDEACDLVLLAA
jgi:hypothetical protein